MTPHQPNLRRAGFSMIEMIGVLAVMAILAAMLMPNVVRRIAEARGTKEEANLDALAAGLIDHIRANQSVPGAAAWASNIAAVTGLSLNEVRRVDPSDANSARVFLVHPGFTPSTGTDPILTNLVNGLAAPSNARLMILSATKSSLALPVVSGKASDTGSNRQVFEDIWNWSFNPSTQEPPAGWPAAWTGQGRHLRVARVNLAPYLHHVTFSNHHFPANIPFARINQLATRAFNVTNAVDGWYLEGTTLRLFKHDTPYSGPPSDPDELDLTHALRSDMNFIYGGDPAGWSIP